MNFRTLRVLSVLLRKDFMYLTTISHCSKIHCRSTPKYKTTPVTQHGGLLYFSNLPLKCWQCDYPHKSELFCSNCKALQKLPKDLNYFDIIGIKKGFDVPIEDLQRKYRQLQTLLHPDRFGQKSDKEKKISGDLSSLVNKAYNTLLHPLDRGLYLLKLHNVLIPEETTNLDPEFLMEIMEKNEEIEEAFENEKKALELLKENQATISSLVKQISKAFQNENIDEAKRLLIRMKYYISIDKRLKQLKQDLGIIE